MRKRRYSVNEPMRAAGEVSIKLRLGFDIANSDDKTTDRGGDARPSGLKDAARLASAGAKHFSYIFEDRGIRVIGDRPDRTVRVVND